MLFVVGITGTLLFGQDSWSSITLYS